MLVDVVQNLQHMLEILLCIVSEGDVIPWFVGSHRHNSNLSGIVLALRASNIPKALCQDQFCVELLKKVIGMCLQNDKVPTGQVDSISLFILHCQSNVPAKEGAGSGLLS